VRNQQRKEEEKRKRKREIKKLEKSKNSPKLRTVEGRTRGRGFFPPSRRPWGGTG
jgi:hypothetical protein